MGVAEAVCKIVLGEAMGKVYLPERVVAGAADLAKNFYANAVETDFNEQVETFSLPSWLKAASAELIPDVSEFGFCLARTSSEIVATAGVDAHTDDAHGFVLVIVLHNDGLSFRQGKKAHKHAAGEWFIFDDRINHSVKETRADGAYVAWTIPLSRL